MELKPFSYSLDFKEGKDPVELVSGRDCKINFKGIVEFQGRKCLKLDVSFTNKEYGAGCTWRIPAIVPEAKTPAEGKLKFSARVFLGEETDVPGKGDKFSLGTDFSFWPSGAMTGMKMFPGIRGVHKGQWQNLEADLNDASWKAADIAVAGALWGVRAEEIGRYFGNQINIYMLRMAPGARMVVYLAEIRIEGAAPEAQAYRALVEQRLVPLREKTVRQLSAIEKRLAGFQAAAAALAKLPPEGEKQREELKKRLAAFANDGEFAAARTNAYMKTDFFNKANDLLGLTEVHLANLRILAEKGEPPGKFKFYAVKPVNTPAQRILPDELLVYGRLCHEPVLEVATCAGKYEPASFALTPRENLANVQFEVSELKGESGSLPASSVDIRTVKCWYQNRNNKRVLMPELLLKDDSLVKVDGEKKENYLKLHVPQEEKYIWISDPTPSAGLAGSKVTRGGYRNEECPVRDSAMLLPLDLPAGRHKQFWLTIRAPEDTPPGTYHGNILLKSGDNPIGTIKLTLRILPFKLEQSDFFTIMYGAPQIPMVDKGTLGGAFLSAHQYRAELENLHAHGINNIPTDIDPIGFLAPIDWELARHGLEIAAEISGGANGRPFFGPAFYSLLGKGLPHIRDKFPVVWKLASEEKKILQENVKKIIALVRAYGYTDVYIYGLDEAGGDRLAGQREAWAAVKEAGGKIYVTGHKGKNGNLDAMGDLQDLFLSYDHPNRAEAAQWHAKGGKIWSVWTTGGRTAGRLGSGVEDPEAHRRLWGLLPWWNKYDGVAYYSYHEGFCWNDFDKYRACAIAYPTVDGVIDTIQWEGLREGVDDVRYALTLEKKISEAKKNGRNREAAAAAEKYLETLEVEYGDLDEIRAEIIGQIMNLN